VPRREQLAPILLTARQVGAGDLFECGGDEGDLRQDGGSTERRNARALPSGGCLSLDLRQQVRDVALSSFSRQVLQAGQRIEREDLRRRV
jgi:hypothetical protein